MSLQHLAEQIVLRHSDETFMMPCEEFEADAKIAELRAALVGQPLTVNPVQTTRSGVVVKVVWDAF